MEEIQRSVTKLAIERMWRDDKREQEEDVDMDVEGEEGEVPPLIPAKPEVPRTILEGVPVFIRSQLEVIKQKIRDLEKKLEASKGSKSGDGEKAIEARVAALEARLAVLEVGKDIDEEWVSVGATKKKSTTYDGPFTRSVAQRVEGKADDAIRDVLAVKDHLRLQEAIVDQMKEGMEMLGKKMAKVDGDIGRNTQQTAGIDTKIEELRLRHSLVTREIQNGKGSINAGLLARVSKLESRFHAVDYRLVTLEEQMGWTERKLRLFWLIYVAQGHPSIYTYATNLRTTWDTSTDALRRRVVGAPHGIVLASNAVDGILHQHPFVPTNPQPNGDSTSATRPTMY